MDMPGRPCRKECQSGHMKPFTFGALCELSNNVVEKLASKYSNVEKEVTEVMGGKVLNYRSKEIYLEGCAFGRKEEGKYCAIGNQKISAWRQSRKDRQGSLDE